jgi:hypothetical protein
MKSKDRLAAYRAPQLVGANPHARAPLLSWTVWLLPALALLLIASMSIFQLGAYDLWWQLKTGELIWTSRSVPHEDVFSHTAAGHPWYVQEWLAEVFFYGLYRLLSPEGLVAFKILALSAAFGVVVWRCWLRSGSPVLAAAITTLAACAARTFFDIRPHLFSYVLLSVTLLILEQWRRGKWERALWLLPPIALLWVNLHGAFMLIFAILGVEIAAELWEWISGQRDGRRLRPLLGVFLLCAAAGLLNPNGLDGYRYAFLLLRHEQMLNDIAEWASPDFHGNWTKAFGFLILLLTLGPTLDRRGSPRDLLLMAGLLHSALFSVRHVPLFAIACAPIVVERLAAFGQRLEHWMTARRWSCAPWRTAATTGLGIVFCCGIGINARRLPEGSWFDYCTRSETFPAKACDYLLANEPGGKLFNPYAWGGYCIWRLWPRYQVFIDGRAEVYFDSGYAEYFEMEAQKPGWEENLHRREVDIVLMQSDALPVGGFLENPAWRCVYTDDQAIIFKRVARTASSTARQEAGVQR